MIREVLLRQLGETMDTGTIAAWHKRVGEWVEKGEPLCSVETDKAVLELEADASGHLVKIAVPEGETVPVLKVIGYLADRPDELVREAGAQAPGPSGAQLPDGASGSTTVPTAAATDGPAAAAADGPPLRISPVAKRVAREHGVDVSQLRGTGPRGRIIEADVQRYLQEREQAAETPAAVVPSPPPPSLSTQYSVLSTRAEWDLVPLTRIRRTIAERLAQSYHEAVHVTLHAEVDMAEASKLRMQLSQEWEARHGVKVTFTDLIVKACAKALTDHRALNATFTPEGIRQHRQINVGVAVAIPAGLVVPVVRNTDALPLLELAQAVRRLTERARAGQITPDEMHGGTFTVTNMGTMGVDTFTPIINSGEGAILGVGRIAERAVVYEGSLAARPTMPASLSFDHRLVDGAGAAAFLARVKQILESPYLILV